MAKLGQIEAVAKDVNREADTFDMLGQTFSLRARPNGMDALDFTALVEVDDTDEEAQGEATAKLANLCHRVLKKCLTPQSYDLFREVVEENELGFDVIMQTVRLLLSAAAGRPTGKPSDSSDGQGTTSMSSLSEPVGLLDYAEKGLQLVPAEDWAKKYLQTA